MGLGDDQDQRDSLIKALTKVSGEVTVLIYGSLLSWAKRLFEETADQI